MDGAAASSLWQLKVSAADLCGGRAGRVHDDKVDVGGDGRPVARDDDANVEDVLAGDEAIDDDAGIGNGALCGFGNNEGSIFP